MPNPPNDPTDEGRLIGYARVSTTDQTVEMQIEALLRAGVQRENIHSESISGSKKTRPELEEALLQARPGDTLVVWKLDRIARSLFNLLELLQRMETGGIKFVSLTDGIETKTPAGRMLLHILGTIAEFEHDLMQERTRAGIDNAKRNGVRFGAPKQVSDESIAEAWQRVHERRETRVAVAKELGITTHQLARRLKEHERQVIAKVAAVPGSKKKSAKGRTK